MDSRTRGTKDRRGSWLLSIAGKSGSEVISSSIENRADEAAQFRASSGLVYPTMMAHSPRNYPPRRRQAATYIAGRLLVAQTCSLLYRRLAACYALRVCERVEFPAAWQRATLRYSGLQVCATGE